ncbi:dolichol kinase [Toxoplasma gondii CAST]|uniref:dolichol kinase n=1 Tax=Toxoplasma gondii CAST TaxID=943122 RepID=A0A425I8U6_TOXGO|nr:dolichol kinase [Toxoplasma gondii CAST]
MTRSEAPRAAGTRPSSTRFAHLNRILLAPLARVAVSDYLLIWSHSLWSACRIDGLLLVVVFALSPGFCRALFNPLLPLIVLATAAAFVCIRNCDHASCVSSSQQPVRESSDNEKNPLVQRSESQQDRKGTVLNAQKQKEGEEGAIADCEKTLLASGVVSKVSSTVCGKYSWISCNGNAVLSSQFLSIWRVRVGSYGLVEVACHFHDSPTSDCARRSEHAKDTCGVNVTDETRCCRQERSRRDERPTSMHFRTNVKATMFRSNAVNVPGSSQVASLARRYSPASSRRIRDSSTVVAALLFPGLICTCLLELQRRGIYFYDGALSVDQSLQLRACVMLVPGLLGGSFLGRVLWTHSLSLRSIAVLVAIYTVAWLSWISFGALALDAIPVSFYISVAISFFLFICLQLLVFHACYFNRSHCFTLVEGVVLSQLISVIVFVSASDCLESIHSARAAGVSIAMSQTPAWLVFVSRMFLLLTAGLACASFVSTRSSRCMQPTRAASGTRGKSVLLCGFVAAVGLYLFAGCSPAVEMSDGILRNSSRMPRHTPFEWIIALVFGDSVNAGVFCFWLTSSFVGVASIIAFWSHRDTEKQHDYGFSQSSPHLIVVRKLYHFLFAANVIVGLVLRVDELLVVVLCGVVWVTVFCEFVRTADVASPFSQHLASLYNQFADDRDQNGLFLTHIYLALGITLPFVSTPVTRGVPFSSRHLLGLSLVGMGDASAAVVGALFGKRRLPMSGSKTLAGFIGFFIGALPVVILEPLHLIGPQQPGSDQGTSFGAAVSAIGLGALFEAYTSDIDNLTLPLFGVIVYDNVSAVLRSIQ